MLLNNKKPSLSWAWRILLYRDAFLFFSVLFDFRLTWAFAAAFLQRPQRDVEQWDEQQVQRSRGEHATEDRGAYRLTSILTGASSEYERQHAEDESKRRH